ncbi:MAG: acyl-CoA thioesterase [Aureliella sp.]
MGQVFETQRRVEFCETDAAGIVHFSSYVRYMEQAEHEFWRSLGTSVMQPLGDGVTQGWPRVRVECDFRGVARFEDVLSVELVIENLGQKSIRFRFEFKSEERVIASGRLTTVCCRVEHGQELKSIPISDELRELLGPYVVGDVCDSV